MHINSEEFIGLVKTKPAIYNYSLKEHHNKEILDECWDDISKAFEGAEGLFSVIILIYI